MNQEKGSSPIFCEVQKFRQVWILVLVLVIAGMQWYAAVEQLLLHRPFGTNPVPDVPLTVFCVIFGIGLPALFLFGKLITEVRDNGIILSFAPFHWIIRKIRFMEVKQCEVRTYHPLREFGGWGIRFGCKGMAYNVSGDRGVQIELLNGKRLLIGSQRAEEFLRAIQVKVSEQEGKSA